ncbi:hypothetical protein NITHO_5340002 [Nitrolancea hollandica Lb]|uniref:Uncharacterized protein n=1 Tax=Nitrolancea hollandica Lb TaxID=1129897 RepID=I4ELV6_9BACT|nr:hypothetical protein NITHO_5340002 [Nitrolancea hollandica Lb]
MALEKALAIPSFSVDWFDRAAMVQMLREQAGDARRFWLVQSPDRLGGEDPDAILEGWLAENGTKLDELRVNGVRVTPYELSTPISR